MWIHQRVGQNTAVSTPLWTLVLGVFVVVGAVAQIWPLLMMAGVAYVVFLVVRYYGDRSETAIRLAQRFRERD